MLSSYLIKPRDQLQIVQQIVGKNLQEAQARQKGTYVKKAKSQEFVTRDKVLLLLLDHNSNLLARWQSPYDVMWRVGPVDYKILQPGQC